jgi:hypothetical protein
VKKTLRFIGIAAAIAVLIAAPWSSLGAKFVAAQTARRLGTETMLIAQAQTSKPQTVFTTQTPTSPNKTDGIPYELGLKFRSTKSGQITAIRHWKASGENGSHVGRLWTTSGKLLAQVNFTNETASGWQRQALSTPISIKANTTYIVSVNVNRNYPISDNQLASSIVNGDLSTVADGNNGVFNSKAGSFPTSSWFNSNYFRDVEMQVTTSTPTPTPSPTPTPTPSPTPTPTPTSPPPASGPRSRSMLPPAGAALSKAYGLWQPSAQDTCPQWLHDTYWTYGPDGKVYPVWHPPTDTNPDNGQSCTYGHEHGRDPSQSRIGSWGLPFGYVNEVMQQYDPANPRHEDHVGHKIDYKNDVRVGLTTGGTGPVCQILTKLHQGTHSADAFGNNMHELFYYVSCDNGIKMRWRGMQIFGVAGQFKGACGPIHNTGTYSPSTSPTTPNQSDRTIPDKECLDNLLSKTQQGVNASSEYYSLLTEDWNSGFQHELRQSGGQYYDNWGQEGANVNGTMLLEMKGGSYFNVSSPSRYFDPTKTNNLGRQIDMCFISDLKYTGDCYSVQQQINNGNTVTWDSPNSPFKGTKRTIHYDWVRMMNTTAQETWYSNAMGTVIRPQPDPSQGITVEQLLTKIPNGVMYNFGTATGDFNAPGVHAPN